MATTDEGMSTSKKVVAGAALGVAIPAAVGAAKKLMGNGDDSDGSRQPTQRRKKSATSSRSKATKPRSAAKSRSTKAGSAKRATTKRASTAKRRSTTSKRSTSAKTRSASTRSAATPTREQLYRQATRLKIDGRSSMTKAELQRAVNRAKSRAK